MNYFLIRACLILQSSDGSQDVNIVLSWCDINSVAITDSDELPRDLRDFSTPFIELILVIKKVTFYLKDRSITYFDCPVIGQRG